MSLSKLFACSTALALAAACSNGGSAVSLSARVGAATAATRAPQQGSLTLANRPGDAGCVATLRLPA